MDFIRKNWSRLSLAFLYFIGGVIAVIAWINNSDRFSEANWVYNFYNIALFIATIIFFFGMVGLTIMKSLANSKKVVSVLYMCVGGVITVLLLVLLVVATSNDSTLIVVTGVNAVEVLYQMWVPFVVFGLYPLIKGVTRFIEAEFVPAPATVKPAAQTATAATASVEAPAAAPKATKAPAKKAAPKTPAAK